MSDWKTVNAGRVREGAMASDDSFGFNGAFRFLIGGVKIKVIASDGVEWKPVKGFESLYEVSNTGEVRSCAKSVQLPYGGFRHQEQFVLSQERIERGYRRVSLSQDGETNHAMVHRLVADAFIPNGVGFPFVNHRDGNKENNAVMNLEWCSEAYNQHHAIESGLRSGFTEKEIIEVRRLLEAGASCVKVAEIFSCSRGSISHIKSGNHRDLNPDPPLRFTGLPPWQHVSVSIHNSGFTPSWQIMCIVKDLFWEPEDVVVQFHPRASEYVNHHPGCLHLWRCIDGREFPTPPPNFVGPK